MKTNHLRVNQLSALTYQKYLQYLDALDKKDISAYGKFLADNVSVQFNNDAPMIGKENVLQGLSYYWQTFGTLEHELINIYGTDKTFVLEAKNYYIRKDGKPATVNAVAFTDLDDKELVNSVRIYQDVSPVFK